MGAGRRPAVSVLLPVRDAGQHLIPCLRSLSRQSFADFEVVAVDDGSQDDSPRILASWAAGDPRFRVLRQPPRGLVETLNTGLEACRAPLVARLDADDVAAHRRLERQVVVMQDPETDVVSCWVRHIPRRDVAAGLRHYERWLNRLQRHDDIVRERFIESPIAHPSAMVRRQRLAEVGGYRDVGWPEDYDLWLRLAEAGARFVKVPEYLHFWRDHERRLTRTDERYATARFLDCKAHFLARGPLADRRVLLWGAGPTGRRLGRGLRAAGVTIDAWLDIDPVKIGRTRQGRPILDAERVGTLWRDPSRPVVVTAVARRGARELIRDRLRNHGLEEGRDFWCAA